MRVFDFNQKENTNGSTGSYEVSTRLAEFVSDLVVPETASADNVSVKHLKASDRNEQYFA